MNELTRRQLIPSLTGLRIVAAFAVYLSHLGMPAGAPAPLRVIAMSGYCGVTVFFILSGFVLTISYFDDLTRPKPGKVWRYAAARIGRVYPAYLAVLVFVWFQQLPGGTQPGIGLHLGAVEAWNDSAKVAYSFNGPAWSISVEFFLYACFPLLVVAFSRVRRASTMVVGIAATIAVLTALAWWFTATGRADLSLLDGRSAHRWLYRMPLTRLGDFVIGILAARAVMTVHRVRWGGWLASAGAVSMVWIMSRFHWVNTAWSFDVLYVPSTVAVLVGLAACPAGWLARGLSVRPMVVLGEMSYAFYLVHQRMLVMLGAGWVGGWTLTGVAVETVNLAAVLCVAYGLHVAIERPGRDLVRRWSRVRGRPVHHGAASAATPGLPEVTVP